MMEKNGINGSLCSEGKGVERILKQSHQSLTYSYFLCYCNSSIHSLKSKHFFGENQ